jgi:hypothetical protein
MRKVCPPRLSDLEQWQAVLIADTSAIGDLEFPGKFI